jgi:hypothetical protein
MNKINKLDRILKSLFFLGIILNLFCIKLYSKTVINFSQLVILYLLTGLVFFFFFDKIFKVQLQKVYKFVYTTVVFGSSLASLLLSINFYLNSTKEIYTEQFQLSNQRYGLRQTPKADIKIEGIVKTFIFSKSIKIEDYQSINLKLTKGKLGFTIIQDKSLVK